MAEIEIVSTGSSLGEGRLDADEGFFLCRDHDGGQFRDAQLGCPVDAVPAVDDPSLTTAHFVPSSPGP